MWCQRSQSTAQEVGETDSWRSCLLLHVFYMGRLDALFGGSVCHPFCKRSVHHRDPNYLFGGYCVKE
ncbi:hypothetical protein QZH41_017621 [Actinostola sp. cb2023]|nr:hypothetical protein QZH41_017621 [Actinostola sp. cb2023]